MYNVMSAMILVPSEGALRASLRIPSAVEFGWGGLFSLLGTVGTRVVSELDFAVEALELVDERRGDTMKYSDACCAITGTNGKSTVTTFVGQLLSANNGSPFVGGNLVRPLEMSVVTSSCHGVLRRRD